MQHERIFRPTSVRWPLPREKWPGCVKQWRLPLLVLILTAALFFTSCASTRKSTSEQSQTTSVTEIRDTTATIIKQTRWEIIPESKVEIAVSVDSLLKLPEGAAYTKRSGQANIKVATHGDTVYITGTCDSLQRQVEYYEALYHTARDALEQQHEQYQQERKQRTSPALIGTVNLIAGLFAGVFLTSIIITKRKNNE